MNLLKLRQSKNLSQRTLAKKMGTSQSVISRMEIAQPEKLSIETIKNYVEALGYEFKILICSSEKVEAEI